MVKFYFFKTVRNGGRQKLRALPGQTTYYDLSHRNQPVNTEWDVQSERDSRTIQCAYPDGTIFGIKLESNRERDTRLIIHSRNNVDFYRIEAKTYVIKTPYEMALRSSEDANAEITAAYESFASSYSTTTETQNNARPTIDPATQVPVSNISLTNSQMLAVAKLDEERINDMSAYIGSNPMGRTLIMLSQLRDRLAIGVAKFVYTKTNGDTRVAFGTLNTGLLRGRPHEHGEEDSRCADGAHFNYYDLQQNDWRCFCTENFISVDLSWDPNNDAVPPRANS